MGTCVGCGQRIKFGKLLCGLCKYENMMLSGLNKAEDREKAKQEKKGKK